MKRLRLVPAAQDFVISCEGKESSGGGTYTYQYTLKNIGATPVTLTDLLVATEDPKTSNYAFMPTTGFTATIVPNDGALTNIQYTTGVKTPHGTVPVARDIKAVAIIHWSGSALVAAGDSITFAYDNPNPSWDHEWHANTSAGWTISQLSSAIAGPKSIYTDVYVHAPAATISTPALTTWGIVILLALVLMAAMWVLIRRQKRAASMA